MASERIGFIGLGEVGTTFSREMKGRGADVYYFDVVEKGSDTSIPFLPFEGLIRDCDVIISTVTTQKALDVAEEASRYLKPGKIYADLNSTSPSVKRRIAEVIESTGANFVEGAILSAVGETKARASILVCGERGEYFAQLMNGLGLVNLRYLSSRVGEASLVKMVRSIFSKGVECLLIEMLIAGKRAGVADYLWRDIVDFMTNNAFESIADNWIRTHPLACERRYYEMLQVIETMEELRVDPMMTRATCDFFKRSVEMKLGKRFNGKPKRFLDVPTVIDEAIGKG